MRWPRSSSDWYSFERLAFFGLLALSLIPILVFTHFPTEDGPLHMANAAIYRFADSPLFREFYEFSLEPIPNMTADVALSVLLGVMKAELAHKVMALLLAIGLPLAFRWCLSSIRRDAVWLAALVIPVAQGRFLYNGYWNFQVGVVLALVTLGHWMAFMRRGDRSPVRWLIASASS